MRKFQVGDKVVPTDKEVRWFLEHCAGSGKDHLVVTAVVKNGVYFQYLVRSDNNFSNGFQPYRLVVHYENLYDENYMP